MVLESTMICVDNSEFMRNGDFIPTRFCAQQDAVNLVIHSKTRSNAENNVGLMTLANVKVLCTLTSESSKMFSKLYDIKLENEINFVAGVQIAHLALKNRLMKQHKMRIVCFIGSPVNNTPEEITRVAKILKKEKVNVDIINFGEQETNSAALTNLINILNGGKEEGNSHLVTIFPDPHITLSNALRSSPIIDDGRGSNFDGVGGYGFDVDPNEDPELALALRVSMEEQRQKQEEEARKSQNATEVSNEVDTSTIKTETKEEALFEQALRISMENNESVSQKNVPDLSKMTEEEQIVYAMQMSLQDSQEEGAIKTDVSEPMEIDGDHKEGASNSVTMADPAFLQNILENLPGIDPQSEAVKSALQSLSSKSKEKSTKDSEKEGPKK